MTIVFNRGYIPRAGIINGLIADKFGQLYFLNDREGIQFAQKHKLRYWVFGELTEEEERTGSYRINHFERYEQYNRQKMTDREGI